MFKKAGNANNALLFNAILFILGFGQCFSAFAQVDEFAKRLLQAEEKVELIPNLSKEKTVGMASAYQIQTAYVRERLAKDKISGFKAGLTSCETQAHFGINRPIFGVLLKSGDYSKRKTDISLKQFRRLEVETELGFITKNPITKTVNSIEELKSYIDQVIPVIELPDVGFTLPSINGIDLVAANAGAAAYIMNTDINWYGQNVNSFTVTLSHNGEIVNQGQGDDALGDQWEALRWLVNQVLANGWHIEKGYLLITGALGQIVSAEEGVYQAQFNDGATMEFSFIA